MTPTRDPRNASDALPAEAWVPLLARHITRVLYTAPEAERLRTWRNGERLLAALLALLAQMAWGELDRATGMQRCAHLRATVSEDVLVAALTLWSMRNDLRSASLPPVA